MKDSFKNFTNRLENSEIKKIWNNHSGVKKKFFDFFYSEINKIEKPQIIEFGVRHGVSTSLFLDICEINNGFLYSIDENDYSKNFKSSKWKFIKSRDDNFQLLKKTLPSNVDVIFLDKNMNIIGFKENNQPHSLKSISINKASKYVLEMNAGTVKKFNLKKGDKIYFLNLKFIYVGLS